MNAGLKHSQHVITSMNLGDPMAWNLERDFYLQQRDGSSCGPILILAFFEAYTGQAMFPGVGFGALYQGMDAYCTCELVH